MAKDNGVYLVRQTQYNIFDPNVEYMEKTIYVCSTRERANEYARRLNDDFACGVVLDDYGLFEYVKDTEDIDDGDVHYYDVESMTVDRDIVIEFEGKIQPVSYEKLKEINENGEI